MSYIQAGFMCLPHVVLALLRQTSNLAALLSSDPFTPDAQVVTPVRLILRTTGCATIFSHNARASKSATWTKHLRKAGLLSMGFRRVSGGLQHDGLAGHDGVAKSANREGQRSIPPARRKRSAVDSTICTRPTQPLGIDQTWFIGQESDHCRFVRDSRQRRRQKQVKKMNNEKGRTACPSARCQRGL